MKGELSSSLKEQGKAIMVMMSIGIISVLAMIVLDYFSTVVKGIPGLGNASAGTVNTTVQATLLLFITSFGIVGSFASITMLIIVVKAIIGVVRGLKT